MSDPFDLFDPYGAAATQPSVQQPTSSRQPQQQGLTVYGSGPVVPYSNTNNNHTDDVDLLSHQYSQQSIAPSRAITYDDPFAALTGVSNSPAPPQAGVDFLDQLDFSSAPSKPKSKSKSASSSTANTTTQSKAKAKATPAPAKKNRQQHEEEEEREEQEEEEQEEEDEGVEGEPGEEEEEEQDEEEMERKHQPRKAKASAVTKRAPPAPASASARPTSARTKAPPAQSAAAVYAAQAKAPTPAKAHKHKQPEPEFSDDEESEEDQEEEEDEEAEEEEQAEEEEEEEEEEPQPVKKKAVKKPAATASAKPATGPAKPVKAATGNVLAPQTVKVDVLAYMKRGSKFLKYGKYGYPHFRQFQLTDDNLKIVWFTHAKKLSESQVSILDIDEVRLGQTTPNFFKHQTPDLAPMSFSIMYQGGKKSLDLVASDPTDYKMWLEGLKMLIAKGEHGGAKEIKNARVAVTVTKKPASSTPAAHQARPTGNHHLYQTVQKNFEALKAKFLKRTEQLKESKYYMSPVNSSMQAIVTKVHAQVKKIHELFQAHDYQACDDEIWKASLELETLKNMMRAVKT